MAAAACALVPAGAVGRVQEDSKVLLCFIRPRALVAVAAAAGLRVVVLWPDERPPAVWVRHVVLQQAYNPLPPEGIRWERGAPELQATSGQSEHQERLS